MKKITLVLSSLAALFALARSAQAADMNVRIDEARDNLQEAERTVAKAALAQAMESCGHRLVNKGAAGTYVLSHVRIGKIIVIRLAGPRGAVESHAGSMEELPSLYRRMMVSLDTGKPMTQTEGRANVPRDHVAPRRDVADKLFYSRLGYGALPGVSGSGGPDLGLGLRLELDRVGLDASVNLGLTRVGPGMNVEGLRGSWAKLTAQYFLTPDADGSAYLGGGLSWGGESASICNQKLSGSGLQGEVVAGYEALRSSTIRLFVQADATLPFYMATREGGASPMAYPRGALTAARADQRYLPTLGLSLGIGWGQPHVLGVAKVR